MARAAALAFAPQSAAHAAAARIFRTSRRECSVGAAAAAVQNDSIACTHPRHAGDHDGRQEPAQPGQRCTRPGQTRGDVRRDDPLDRAGDRRRVPRTADAGRRTGACGGDPRCDRAAAAARGDARTHGRHAVRAAARRRLRRRRRARARRDPRRDRACVRAHGRAPHGPGRVVRGRRAAHQREGLRPRAHGGRRFRHRAQRPQGLRADRARATQSGTGSASRQPAPTTCGSC